MKKILTILLCSIAVSVQSQVVYSWKDSLDASSVNNPDTVVQGFYNTNKDVSGTFCTCSFDISNLNANTSVIKMGGSNMILTGTPRNYYVFVSFSDSITLSKILWAQTNHTRGKSSDTTHMAEYQIQQSYGYEKPAFKWIKNTVTSGKLYWKCNFYKR